MSHAGLQSLREFSSCVIAGGTDTRIGHDVPYGWRVVQGRRPAAAARPALMHRWAPPSAPPLPLLPALLAACPPHGRSDAYYRFVWAEEGGNEGEDRFRQRSEGGNIPALGGDRQERNTKRQCEVAIGALSVGRNRCETGHQQHQLAAYLV